jgi:zinc transport system substrate-binding protein
MSTIFALLLLGCSERQIPARHQTESAPFVVAVNGPLQYFAQRLLANEVEVRMLVPQGTDPAQWWPNVGAVLQLQQARLVLLNGAGYSSWLDKVSISDDKLVNTSESATDRWIALEDQVTHSHGPAGEHAHSGYAFTTWMDMNLARVQAEAVAKALSEHWPSHRETIAENLTKLLADIDALDDGYQVQASRLAGRKIIFSHPVYQYFVRRYGMSGQTLHWEPDVMPPPEQWQLLHKIAIKGTLFIWEAAPSQEVSVRISEMGISSIIIDPAANPAERDWLTVQRDNLTSLQQVAGY